MTIGVVLATYGSPQDVDDIARYLEDIIGRKPSQAQVEALADQYRQAGGVDLLPEVTGAQAEKLRDRLGDGYVVRVGYEHSRPWIADVVEDLARDVDRLVVLPLAPHYNTKSVAGYHASAREGLGRLDDPPPAAFVDDHHDRPGFVDLWADRIRAGLDRVDADDVLVVFTAHSLPSSVREDDDPYPEQVERSCKLVADAAGVEDWRQVYQSAPPHGDWLGPDVVDALDEVADDHDGVVCAPIGFASDHMETRYDLDVEAAERAAELGLAFERVEAPNDDDRYIACLADTVREAG